MVIVQGLFLADTFVRESRQHGIMLVVIGLTLGSIPLGRLAILARGFGFRLVFGLLAACFFACRIWGIQHLARRCCETNGVRI